MATASVVEQMAPAKRGMVQCQMPDVLFKTCQSISRVWQTGPESWRFESRILLDPAGPVVLTEHNSVTVEGRSICETVRLASLEDMAFSVGGVPANAAQIARYRAVLKRQFALVGGKRICTEIVPNEQAMHKVVGTIDGKRVPSLDYAMKWVGANEGWTVAP